MNKVILTFICLIPLLTSAQPGLMIGQEEEAESAPPSGPGLIPDLKIWFRADTLVTYASNTVSAISNIVTNEDADYFDGSNTISYQAGQDSLQFTGTGYFDLFPPINYIFTGDTITVIALHSPSSTSIKDFLYVDDAETYGTKVQLAQNGVQIRSDLSGRYSYYTGFNVSSKGLFYIEIPAADLVDSRVEVDGTQYNPQWAFGSQVMTTNVDKVQLGRNNSGVFYEVCVYDRALTSSEKTFISAYFNNRYGL